MSTMYYTYKRDGREIAQIHSLGKNKGYHTTWFMYPLEFAVFFALNLEDYRKYDKCVEDEYGKRFTAWEFKTVVEGAHSQSFSDTDYVLLAQPKQEFSSHDIHGGECVECGRTVTALNSAGMCEGCVIQAIQEFE